MDLNVVDNSLIEKLREALESIVGCGLNQADESKMKEIKKICRISDIYVKEAYKITMHHLNQKHSEVRLACLLIFKELFQRSHYFRELLVADFQDFSKLVLDIDPRCPLPPPPAASKQLKVTAMKTIKEWSEVYGEAYKKLKIGYLYLKRSKAVDFEDMEARSAQERQRIQDKEAKLLAIKQTKLKSLMEELSTEEAEVIYCVTQIENGFDLLLPDEFSLKEHSKCADPSDSGTCDFRAHGITNNATFNLVIEVQTNQTIQVSEDNREIIKCMQDQYRLLTSRFLPMVFKWNVTAAKLGAEERLQKQILDLKLKVELVIKKYQELNLSSCNTQLDSSSESDLETVPDLDNYGNDVDGDIINYAPDEWCDSRPRTSGRQAPKKQKLDNERKLLLDIDSYASSQSNLPVPTFSRNPVESYWVQDPESGQGETVDLVTHPVELSEAFCPVKWSCRAPLPSGKLCPRNDRKKCPLHGPIVARNELGQPKDPLSVRSPIKPAIPDWQEPSLLAEIKAATGVDLTMPTKGKRLKKNPFPNLTDIKALKNTSRSRLEKKIFKRSTNRNVSSTSSTDTKHPSFNFQV